MTWFKPIFWRVIGMAAYLAGLAYLLVKIAGSAPPAIGFP